MEIRKTERWFRRADFKDEYGQECSIQKSSLMGKDCIWLGVTNPTPKVLIRDVGWCPVTLPDNVMVNTRMHLTQEQAAELIPLLQHFVETGELPE